MNTTVSTASVGYLDGFVIAVAKNKLERYREVAEKAAEIWKEYGAIDYYEAVGDDVNSEFGRPFPQLAGTSEDEVVVFSYITYRDRAQRDEVNAKVMADERMQAMCPGVNPDFEPPFDMARFSYGGFEVFVKG